MRQFLLPTTLTLFLSWSTSLGVQTDDNDNSVVEAVASVRLSEEMLRVTQMVSMSEPLGTEAISAAVALITQASRLTPDDPTIWRAMVEVAQMADLPELRSHAIQELLRVTPSQSAVQLARLRDVIEHTNTVDQRMGVYEQIFSTDKKSELDSRVASRLAFDAAQLQRQRGDIIQFALWLRESVALDPSNPDSMSLAAGFFGDETADVYSRAELLASTVLSNIRDITTKVTLAEYLMALGDYKDANALYEIILGDNAGNLGAIQHGLLADIVLSQWAVGDVVSAVNTLQERQIAVDNLYRSTSQGDGSRLSPLAISRIHAPLVPKLGTVRAAIFAHHANPAVAAMALGSALDSIHTLSKVYESDGSERAMATVVELYLQAAWIGLWFGIDVATTHTFIQKIETITTIDPLEKRKLDGWIAFREGDLATAETILMELKDDPTAHAGLGLIYVVQGKDKAAANEFLAVARARCGTLLGVWSYKQLQRLVGSTFNIRPEVENLQNLMLEVIRTINAYVLDPRPPIDLRVIPLLRTYRPYEPILVNIEITNNTIVPITISKTGPLQPLLLIEARLEISNLSFEITPPIIIPIDQEISIAPRETIVIQTNLRQQWIGGLINAFPVRGASLQLRSSINFVVSRTSKSSGDPILIYELGRLGLRHETDIFRVNGVRLVDTWLKSAIESAKNVKTAEDLSSFVLLTWVIGDDVTIKTDRSLIPPPGEENVVWVETGERLALQDEAITTVLTEFPSLGPISQAWIVSTMSGDPSIEAIVRMMKEPESAIAQLAWIMRFASTTVPDEALDDPLLLAALSSDDQHVRDIATWIYSWVGIIVRRRAEQQLQELETGL